MRILKLENLIASQGGVEVLHIPALEVNKGQALAVLGPNGSGKTTLLLCIAGLLEKTRGRLFFRDEEVEGRAQMDRLRGCATMVFQEPLLFDATVQANIEAGLRIRGFKGAKCRQRAEEMAKLFGISHLMERSARKLSGGESQRTSLARAFAIEPDLILMDEPFSALDAPTRQSLLYDLGQVLKQSSTTAIFSTHDLGDATCLADSIAVLNEGCLVQHGTVQNVLQSPQDAFVASLVASFKTSINQAQHVISVHATT